MLLSFLFMAHLLMQIFFGFLFINAKNVPNLLGDDFALFW